MPEDKSENLMLGAAYLVSELLLSFAIASFVKLLEPSMAIFEIVFTDIFCVYLFWYFTGDGRLVPIFF